MKFTLVISKMSNSGGTERVMSVFSNELIKRGHKVTIITVSDDKPGSFYQLNPLISINKHNILGRFFNPIAKLLYLPAAVIKLRKAILQTKPDMVISYVDILNIMTLMSLSGTEIPVIATEHFSPGIRKIGFIWEFLRKVCYKKAQAVTVLTPEDKVFFPDELQNKIIVMPNPVSKPEKVKTDYSELKYELIAVGRLVKEKGFDILIKAFLIVEKEFPKLKLNIYGSGTEFHDLSDMIDSLDLEDKIFINDPVSNIIDKIISTDIFIHPARLEPFGMVIVEAMSAGVPVIATNCPNGPKNIITHMTDGILVKNESAEEIAGSIKLLLTDGELRKKLGENAKKITEKLSVENFIKKWEELIS
ncbi:MAG: glycosyltransferase family 4 protein [Candidatus Delongbacteria bacterium]|jgi:glycosyltransferase involved in cell wall biosynthesis|nr:glycosyltransferase family 4 protein [Candidatus Delongbacteria bacterium]